MAAPGAVGTLMQLDEIRNAAAAALAPATEADPVVLVDVVDALHPPALMLSWDDPWLEAGPVGMTAGMGPCIWTARLAVICVAGRLEPGPGYATLEQVVSHVLGRLKDDAYSWPFDSVTAPRQFDLAGVTYLAAIVTYQVPATA